MAEREITGSIARMGAPVAAVLLVATACASAGEPAQDSSTTTSVASTSSSTTTAPTTTTEPTTTTTMTTVPATPLEELGYPVSDDWVVETVVADIDAGTGGLAIDANGVFYQGDFGYSGHVGDRVLRVTDDGSIETYSRSDLMESLTMTYLASDGAMYQSSYNSDRVFRIETDGTAVVIAEGLRGPTGIAQRDDGTLVVEAYDSSILHTIAPDGTVSEWVTDRRFNGINGLTMGPDGVLYVIDHKDGSIFSVDPDGEVEKLFKFPKATSHGVYLDGSLFVTSRLGYVVFRYDLGSGDVEIIAGNAEPGDRDGRGGEASFGRPNAIAIGPDGHLYINHGGGASNDPVTIRRLRYDP